MMMGIDTDVFTHLHIHTPHTHENTTQEKALRMGYTPDVEDALESSATSSSESKIAASGVSFRYKLLAKPVGLDYAESGG